MAEKYGLGTKELVRAMPRASKARELRLYELGHWAGKSIGAIARPMGVTYSAVSRRVSAVERRLRHDSRWRAKAARISAVKEKNSSHLFVQH